MLRFMLKDSLDTTPEEWDCRGYMRNRRLYGHWTVACIALLAFTPIARAATVLLVDSPAEHNETQTLLHYAVQEALQAKGSTVLYLNNGKTQLQQEKQLRAADKHMRVASAHFEQLEPDAAVNAYVAALKALDDLPLPDAKARTLTEDCLIHLVASHLLLGQGREATPYIRRIMSLSPEYKPDPVLFNPAMREQFGKLASKFSSNTLELQLRSKPAHVAVFVDTRLVGITPLTKNLGNAKHILHVAQTGFRTTLRKMGRTQQLNITLKPLASTKKGKRNIGDDYMQARTLPQSLASLAAEKKATEVIILSAGSPQRALRFTIEPAKRSAASTQGEISDIKTAHTIAKRLVATMYGGPQPSTNQSSTTPGASAVTSTTKTASPYQGLTFIAGYAGGLSLIAGGAVFGALARSDATLYGKTTPIGQTDYDHKRTTDQIEGAPIRKRGKTRALMADLLISVGLTAIVGTLIAQIYYAPPEQPLTQAKSNPLLSPHTPITAATLNLP